MKLTLVEDRAWAQNWSDYADRSFTEGESQAEQLQQAEIEEAINNLFGDSFLPGFDWIVEHHDPPPFVFSLVLQNSVLWRRRLIEELYDRVTDHSPQWSLNLVLIDAIHNGVWDSAEGMVSLFFTRESGLIFKQSGYDRLPHDLTQWFSELVAERDGVQ